LKKGEKHFGFDASYNVKMPVPDTTLFTTWSFLTIAVFHKMQGVVKWIIEEKNSNVNCCDNGVNSPLCTAALGLS
jgi:hypothetical protein